VAVSDQQNKVYGTADHEAPVSRRDFERAIRSLNASDLDIRDALLKLAAHVISLTDELTRRIDKVEPLPSPPNTPAAEPTHTVEQMVAALIPSTLDQIRAQDIISSQRVAIDVAAESKYDVEVQGPPCMELMHICHARCCRLTFSLSTEDLDEGVVRWDYGQPYLIRQRASDGYCVHNSPETGGCTVHPNRPRVCRVYDCRTDERIWIDYEKKIVAPPIRNPANRSADMPETKVEYFDLLDRVQARRRAVHFETLSISTSYSDEKPAIGSETEPKKALFPEATAIDEDARSR
jgi:Fe-S-cluster containining protein